MLKITKNYVTGACSPNNSAAAQCNDGDTVIFETRDCYDDRLMADGTVIEGGTAIANPATGPLYVNGAQKGDVLKVEILDIKLQKTGIMRASIVGGAFCDMVSERRVKQYDIGEDGTVVFNDKLTFKADTMIGVIGTAPEIDSVDTDTPREHGGNMDCNKIVAGSVLYLPVNVPGALLSMGDLHALMGDGEVMICGMETAGDVTVRVSVVKGYPMPTPCLISADKKRFMTIQSCDTLMAASKLSSQLMLKFLMQVTDMDVYEVARLLSLKGDLAICQIVDPLLTVRMEIDTSMLQAYDVVLP